MAVSKKLRFDIFKRDAFTCQYCGRKPPAVVLELEHIHPIAEGGTDDETNLLCSCFDCNRGKGATPLDVIPLSVTERLARQKELAEQVAALNEFQEAQRELAELQVEDIGFYWFNQFRDEKDTYVFSDQCAKSIRQFVKHLTVADIKEAIDLAMFRVPPKSTFCNKTWLYFCKVCWNWIKEGKPE